MLDEHLVKRPRRRDLREAEHLAAQPRRFLRIVPGHDFPERVPVNVADLEEVPQLLRFVALAEVAAESLLTVLAQAVVTVEIVRDQAIDAALNGGPDPRLEDGLPVRIVQTGPVLLHAADAVAFLSDRRAVGLAFQQLQGVVDGLLAECLLVPQLAVEPEEAGRPLRPGGVADEELDVEVADHLDAALVQLGSQFLLPVAELLKPLDREVARIALAMRRVREA